MEKRFVLLLMIFSRLSFAQQDTLHAPASVHLVKVDVFKTLFTQFHLDYERYNGRRGAVEAGISIFYLNPMLSEMYNLPTGPGKYTGAGAELRRKFYFRVPDRSFNMYIAPELSFKYKRYDHHAFTENNVDPASSFSEWYIASGNHMHIGFVPVIGFISSFKDPITIETNLGIGGCYYMENKTIDDPGVYGRHHVLTSPEHVQGFEPLIQLSFKACVKFKFKCKPEDVL